MSAVFRHRLSHPVRIINFGLEGEFPEARVCFWNPKLSLPAYALKTLSNVHSAAVSDKLFPKAHVQCVVCELLQADQDGPQLETLSPGPRL